MSTPNIKPTDKTAIQAHLVPVSQGAATVTTGYVSMQTAENVLATLLVGVMSATSTVDAKLQQAQDGAGTGVKDIAGKAIAQLTQAGGNGSQEVQINCRSEELDVNNGFCFVRLSVTVAAAASVIAALVQTFDQRYQPQAPAASVVQVVS